MSSIGIIIHTDQQTLLSEGMVAVFKQISEVQLVTITNSSEELISAVSNLNVNIVVLIVKELNESHQKLVKNVLSKNVRIRFIVSSFYLSQDIVFKAIKYGAQGFISADSTIKEVCEAILTVRNGFDFFSSSMTSLLMTNYVNDIRNKPETKIKHIDLLSKRELEILTLWGEGLQNSEIAEKLFISNRTVETHKNHIMQKLGTRTTVDLLKFAIRNNIISI